MSEQLDYIKELEDLYKLAKNKGNIPIKAYKDTFGDSCDVDNFRKQADEQDKQ